MMLKGYNNVTMPSVKDMDKLALYYKGEWARIKDRDSKIERLSIGIAIVIIIAGSAISWLSLP